MLDTIGRIGTAGWLSLSDVGNDSRSGSGSWDGTKGGGRVAQRIAPLVGV